MPIMYYRFPPYIRGGLQIEIEGQSFLITSLTETRLVAKIFIGITNISGSFNPSFSQPYFLNYFLIRGGVKTLFSLKKKAY
jgi:hypothetical protein